MSLPPLPAGVRRAFVAYLDVHLGSVVAEQLASQGIEVTGILKNPENVNLVPSSVKKVLKRTDAEGVRKGLLDADYVIFQLVDSAQDAAAAIKVLHTNHFDGEKRFVLVSSLMTWFETSPLTEASPPGEESDEPPEVESLTEDQYNRRVPHMKYLAWRETEKLTAAAHSERLKTFVVFSGLPYGGGEELLHPLFKQAWYLAPAGLPIFGSGKQIVPMIHVRDLAKFTSKLLAAEEIPELRYIFAADDGNASWNEIVKAVNTSLGSGKTYRVNAEELCLHDNIEQFMVNLKVDPQTMNGIMTDEDWVCKSGFVENIDTVVAQYREARKITPLRILILGPPQVGKSYLAREVGQSYRIPSIDIADIITEYKYQEVEFKQELQRIREEKAEAKIFEKLEEKRQAVVEERKAAREAALAERAEGESVPNEDNDDVEEEEEIDVSLTAEEEKEIRDAVAEDNDDERIAAINEKLDELRKVLNLRAKPPADPSLEPPNPKDKKKPAPPPKKDAKKAVVEEVEEVPKESRYTDRALAIMTRWRLTRTQCKNQGYILAGFPKTVRQARLLFGDEPIEIPDEPEDESAPPSAASGDNGEEKPMSDAVFPTHVIQLRASDAYLLDRLQRTQHEAPHNTPEDFQRRLDGYKQQFEGPINVYGVLESSRTVKGATAMLRAVDVEQCPLVLPPPPKSQFASRPADPMVAKLAEFVGKPHNFGPTPQDAHRELVRQRNLAEEQAQEAAEQLRKKKEKEAQEVSLAQKSLQEAKYAANKIKENERQMLEARKAPLKQYLMQQVIPVLTKGLIEVCNRKPEDPIDFLAEWLFRHNPEDDDEMYQ